MTLFDLQNQFRKELANIYPLGEINSIFKLLVKNYLNFDAAELVLEAKKELNKEADEYFQTALRRLLKKEPVQYIIGETSFYNLTFKVNPDVLIPRPETEELVQWIISDIQANQANRKIKILDIGTGSGCIAISLAKNIPNATIWALDISKSALEIAKYNATLNEITINLLNIDILKTKTLPQYFDIIVSNPPYIKLEEKKVMHDNVLQHEPEQALFVSNTDPLIFYKKIVEIASKYLTPNGKLYFEINQYLGKETLELIPSKEFKNTILEKDFLGNDRMIRAEKM